MPFFFIFFFNDTATTEIYTLSLHDALPICEIVLDVGSPRSHAPGIGQGALQKRDRRCVAPLGFVARRNHGTRSEEHTSELQSQSNLVCRLLLEKKKRNCVCLADASS